MTSKITAAAAACRSKILIVLWAALVTLALTIVAPSQMLAPAYAEVDPCSTQAAAVSADRQAIAEHNARRPPGGVGPPEVVIPYNQEADALNAKAAADSAKLRTCIAANARLDAGGVPLRELDPRTRNLLEQARRDAPPGWHVPTPLPQHPWNRSIVVPKDSPAKPAYEALRKITPYQRYPNVKLQGVPRPRIGDIYPARPSQPVGTNRFGDPAVSPDHIVPLAEIVQLPGFMQLNPDNMWRVVNAPLNLQWMPSEINRMKSSRSANDINGVDPEWQRAQQVLQDRKRQELIDIIAQLVDSQVD